MKPNLFAMVAASIVLLSSGGTQANAQKTLASPDCRDKLGQAVDDSLIVELTARVASMDDAHPLSPELARLIGQGVGQFLVLPKPLALDAYESAGFNAAWPTIKGVYRASLTPEGRLMQARAVGGTRAAAFDGAILAAISTLDTSRMLPPLDTAASGAGPIDVSIIVSPTAQWPASKPRPVQPAEDSRNVPLARLRIPEYHADNKGAWPVQGNRAPVYPRAMNGQAGSVDLEFVVMPAGTIDMTSVQAIRATSMPFLQATVDILPSLRFTPLVINGCPVANVVRMPFRFAATK